MVKRTVADSPLPDPAAGWSKRLRVEVGGRGVIAHAGVVLPRLLADRIGLTAGLREVVARRGFDPVRDRGRLLADTVAALVVGASCLTDVEALTRQEALYGPDGGASDTTVLRALSEFADRLAGDGLPDRRLSRMLASVRARAWQQIIANNQGFLPAVRVAGSPLTRTDAAGRPVPVTVLRVDATIIESATMKPGVGAHYKGGIGYHPLTAWCSNIGDHLAVMQRPGNAGSFTATDHVAVLDHALAQVPVGYRSDLLVTIDGAGASHTVIDHLTSPNTHKEHGRRGRRVEYSIGWPVEARTLTAIEQVPERAWTSGLTPDGQPETDAEVADLTGLLRHGPAGDLLTGWPADLRVIGRRTRRGPTEQAQLGEDALWRYGAFVTNTPAGQDHADALHTQRDTATFIIDQGGDFLFTVKRNQPGLYRRLAGLPWRDVPAHRGTEHSHGRTTTRTIRAVEAPDQIGFPGAAQVLQLRRTVTRRDGQRTVEVVYLICSRPMTQAPPATVAAWIRGHWGIEDRLHYVRDVTFCEDEPHPAPFAVPQQVRPRFG